MSVDIKTCCTYICMQQEVTHCSTTIYVSLLYVISLKYIHVVT